SSDVTKDTGAEVIDFEDTGAEVIDIEDTGAEVIDIEDTGAEVIDFDLPESTEFNMDDANDVLEDEEDASEGLLNNTDEVTTKLDLAHAYMDMGDPDGARSILDEVMGEGNDEQKREAEGIISKLG
ncbi:MAG: FimV/HubP family polar landmark protein, partial [Gammaproteobacteria bacterium]|nr:FimV/HubP family polar landmark protein [Gammaproteobacteria bacterium]